MENDALRDFVLERIGQRCVCCGEVVFVQSELDLNSFVILHIGCSSVYLNN